MHSIISMNCSSISTKIQSSNDFSHVFHFSNNTNNYSSFLPILHTKNMNSMAKCDILTKQKAENIVELNGRH